MRAPARAGGGLHAVTTWFNPLGYRARLDNYRHFRDGLAAQGVPLLTIECLVPGQPSALGDFPGVVTVRSEAVLWQKERLLNIALERLPGDCAFVAWLDCDILFENNDWPDGVIALLQDHAVVQPFSEVLLLDAAGAPTERLYPGFAARVAGQRELADAGWVQHGHTGFAWAIRRDAIERFGFFDHCIAGGADHVMAHAFAGNPEVLCVRRLLGEGSPLHRSFQAWAGVVETVVGGSLGVQRGRIRHLWHGSIANRRYLERNLALAALGFDPAVDLGRNGDGCWTWTTPGSPLATFLVEYMRSRQEDTDDGQP